MKSISGFKHLWISTVPRSPQSLGRDGLRTIKHLSKSAKVQSVTEFHHTVAIEQKDLDYKSVIRRMMNADIWTDSTHVEFVDEVINRSLVAC